MPAMNRLRALIWLLPVGGACAAVFILVVGFKQATGAPQEAVVAALACAVTIIPYCFARAANEILDLATLPTQPHPLQQAQPAQVESQQQASPPLTARSRQSFSATDPLRVWRIATVILGGLIAVALVAAFLMLR